METIGRKNDKKVQKILLWRESLTLMPDERFFEIMRTYLGAIQTPYNKPNLIEKLSTIFRKEQNQNRIISYLSEFDLKVLSLVSLIHRADQAKILNFFRSEYTLSAIYAELLNLTERLLIFSYTDPETNSKVIAMNPLLEQAIQPYLGLNCLIPPAVCVERTFESEQLLSPLFLAALVSYISSNPEMIKTGMNLKKKDTDRLESIFSIDKKVFELLLNAFVNLGLSRIKEKSVNLDIPHLEKFALLPETWQYAYFATAGALHLGRTGMRLHAQLLLDLIASVPAEGFTKHSLCAAAFILENSKRYRENQRTSSFSKALSERRSVVFTESGAQEEKSSFEAKYEGGHLLEMMVDSAITLKLFVVTGKDEKGEEVYVPSPVFSESLLKEKNGGAPGIASGAPGASGSSFGGVPKKGLININAGTNVTVMPGFTFAELLPLSVFMEVTKCSTVTEFDVNRKSSSRSFDLNYTPEKIFELLEQYTAYELPQNLKMNVEEWFKTYSSAMLYKGYVLKVEEKTARVLEKNPNIAKYIQLKLAEGIYLLNLPLESDISEFMGSSNLEFMGNIRQAENKAEVPQYPQLAEMEGMSFVEEQKSLAELSKEGEKSKLELMALLKEKQFSKQVQDMLSLRIQKGIILSEEQLRADSVRLEILEADGMNYAGKVRLLENAISQGDSVEIAMSDESDSSKINYFLGKPLSIIKQETDSIVKLSVESESEIEEVKLISVSRAHKIRLIKTSVFN